MMTRLIDFLKVRGTTAMCTSLTSATSELEQVAMGVSSLVDTWVMLEVLRSGRERNRSLTIIKSRGSAHSNQTSEFRLSNRGFELMDTYLGPTGVLTGSARLAQEAQDQATLAVHAGKLERSTEERVRQRKLLKNRIAALREEFATQDADIEGSIQEETMRRDSLIAERHAMARSRQAFASVGRARKPAGSRSR
jgi:circadian clock protein KaiC